MKLELTTVVDRTSACPDGRGAANLVAASRMRLRHRIEADLVEAAVALRTACGRFTDQSQTRAAHAWTLACAAMRCLVSNLSLQWPQSVRPRLSLDLQMRAIPSGALNRLRLSSCTFCQPVVLATTATHGRAIRCTLTDG